MKKEKVLKTFCGCCGQDVSLNHKKRINNLIEAQKIPKHLKELGSRKIIELSKSELKNILFTKKGVPKCGVCGKPMKKQLNSLWAFDCCCAPKNLRLSVG